MKFCNNCKINVSDEHTLCPLCGSKLLKLQKIVKNNDEEFFFPQLSQNNLNSKQTENLENVESSNTGNSQMNLEEIEIFYKKEMIKRKELENTVSIIWVFFTAFSGIVIFILLSISIKFIKSFSWSKYPILSLLYLWLIITNFVFFYKKPALKWVLTFFITIIFLYVLDIFTKGKDWFFPIALPVTITITILIILFLIFLKKIKNKGWNVVGIFVLTIAIATTIIDLLINLNIKRKFDLSWSLFTLSVLIPLSFLFLYFHYGLKKKLKIKRFFHL